MDVLLTTFHPVRGVGRLRLHAVDLDAARRAAERQGYRVLGAQVRHRFVRRSTFSTTLFCTELLALLDAGLSLIEAVDLLQRKAQRAATAQLLAELAHQLRAGRALAAAMQEAGVFPPLLLATLRAGGHTGDIATVLRRYLEHDARLHQLRDKIAAASAYPLLLLGAGTLAVIFMLAYVVPRFAHVYGELHTQLPPAAQILLAWGRLAEAHGGAMLAAAIVLLVLAVLVLRRSAARGSLLHLLARLPFVGALLRQYQLTRLARTLAMLLRGGLPLTNALDLAGDVLLQSALRDGLQDATRAIRSGKGVAEAFAAHALADEVGLRLLQVGEGSGALDAAFEHIANLYDADSARQVDWFVRLFEPLLMLLIGAVVGGLVLLMYLPVFELAGSLQ